MNDLHAYRIESARTGQVFGIFLGQTPQEAETDMLRYLDQPPAGELLFYDVTRPFTAAARLSHILRRRDGLDGFSCEVTPSQHGWLVSIIRFPDNALWRYTWAVLSPAQATLVASWVVTQEQPISHAELHGLCIRARQQSMGLAPIPA